MANNVVVVDVDSFATRCAHAAAPGTAAQVPGPSTRVYKDECSLCFATCDDLKGVDVCLACFQGACPDRHVAIHAARHRPQHPLALNTRREPNVDALRAARTVQELAIKSVPDDVAYKLHYMLQCATCCVAVDVSTPHIEDSLPTPLARVVTAVKNALGSRKQADAASWHEEIVACVHVEHLVQEPDSKSVCLSSAKCSKCDLTSNLWLCLVCGAVGCGRAQFGLPSGGNGHALHHYNDTGHSLAVKLGTITPEGAGDVFCYVCGDASVDASLAPHLATFGIEIMSQEKTDKSMAELQLEQNLRFDFSMATSDGAALQPVCGPMLTGITNLGNSCYMASVLQVMFAIPSIRERYFEKLDRHVTECIDPEDNCYFCQMHKVAHGLASGEYSFPIQDPVDIADGNPIDTSNPTQRGIVPTMFKTLIGKSHPEFSTMRQQDAQEFFQYLCSEIERMEKPYGLDPSAVFKFSLEERIQCSSCKKVKYTDSEALSLTLPVITEQIPHKEGDDEKKVSYKTALLSESLAAFFKVPESVRDQMCPEEKAKHSFSRSQKFHTFPEVLVLNMSRFVVGNNWVVEKLNAPIKADLEIDLNNFKTTGGLQPSEEALPEDSDNTDPSFNESDLNQLLAMGFPEVRCKRALLKTGNNGAESAMNWLFEHMEDNDIDAPLSTAELGTNASGSKFKQADIDSLMDMGFTAGQARRALNETSSNVEMAVDWLFNNPGAEELAEGAENNNSSNPTPGIQHSKATSSSKYQLFAFISHKGTSAQCGHYVAHVMHPEQGWVLFNDNKVVKVEDVESAIEEAYIYFYKQV